LGGQHLMVIILVMTMVLEVRMARLAIGLIQAVEINNIRKLFQINTMKTLYMTLFIIFKCTPSFGQNSSDNRSKPISPDKIKDYQIAPLSEGIVDITCEQLSSGKAITISDTSEIRELYTVLEDAKNFTIDTSYTRIGIEPNNRIDYIVKGAIVKSFCENRGKIEIDGDNIVYRYNKKVRDYLVSHKLIHVMSDDKKR